MTKERVAVELGRIGFANMMDYLKIGPTGDPVLNWSGLTREQAGALTEVTVAGTSARAAASVGASSA